MTDETPNPKPRGGRPKRDRTRPAAEYNHDPATWTTRPIEPGEVLSKAGIVLAEKGEKLTPAEKGQRILQALVPDAVMRIEKLSRSKHQPTALAACRFIVSKGLPKTPTVAVTVNHGALFAAAELAQRRIHERAQDITFTDVEPGDERDDGDEPDKETGS